MSNPLPVAAALRRRLNAVKPTPTLAIGTTPKNRPRIKPDDHKTPIAMLELHGLSMTAIELLETHGNALYLGDVANWTDADFLRVENIGKYLVAEIRTALTRYLRGSKPMLEYGGTDFNAVNAESLASARNGRWELDANMRQPDGTLARHTPWTLQEYKARKKGVLLKDMIGGTS